MADQQEHPFTKEALAEVCRVCACSNFRKATRAVTQLFDTVLQPAGLRSTQLVMMVGIAANEPVTIAQLAREMVMDRTTLTRNLNPLQRDGLIEINTGKDRRGKLITLTPAGYQLLEEAYPIWEAAQQRFVEALGQERWQQTIENLNAAVSATREA